MCLEAACQEQQENNIDELLCQQSQSILNSQLAKDDLLQVEASTLNTENTEDTTVPNALADNQWLENYKKQFSGFSSPYLLQYHESEVKNTTKALMLLLYIFAGTTLFSIILVAICIGLKITDGAIISGVVGAVIDTIIGWMFKVLNTVLESKKSYFDIANETEKMDKMLFVLQTVSDDKIKDSVIADILRKSFNIEN